MPAGVSGPVFNDHFGDGCARGQGSQWRQSGAYVLDAIEVTLPSPFAVAGRALNRE